HRGELIGLARDRRLQVVECRGHAVHGFEVALRVNHLRLGGGAKQPRDIRLAVLLRLARKCPVFLAGLALAGECFVEIRAGAHGVSSGSFRHNQFIRPAYPEPRPGAARYWASPAGHAVPGEIWVISSVSRAPQSPQTTAPSWVV